MYDNIEVPMYGIEWDSEKARTNLKKHGVSFETAQYIFSDPNRLVRFDMSDGNTSGEDRWQILGDVGEILLVVCTKRPRAIRIVMARLATKAERRSYNGYYQIDGGGWTEA